MAITELQYTGINVWWFKVLMKMLLFSTVPITSRAWQMLVWVDIRTGKVHTFLMATFEWTVETINDSAWSSLQYEGWKTFFLYLNKLFHMCLKNTGEKSCLLMWKLRLWKGGLRMKWKAWCLPKNIFKHLGSLNIHEDGLSWLWLTSNYCVGVKFARMWCTAQSYISWDEFFLCRC